MIRRPPRSTPLYSSAASDVYKRQALRAIPRMNTSAQPAEGAGGSRSQAAGELTLGLLSGEKRRGMGCSAFALLWERACSRRRPDSRPISFRCTRSNCGSWLASEGVLPADQFLSNVPSSTVGASLLAKNARTTRAFRQPASSLTSIASKLLSLIHI